MSLADYGSQDLARAAIMMEYNQAKGRLPSNLYLVPSPTDFREWGGILYLTTGSFHDCAFRIRVCLPEGYPGDGCFPEVFLEPPPFHPLYHPESGRFALRALIGKWTANKHFVRHAMRAVKNSFTELARKGRAWVESPHRCHPAAAQAFAAVDPEQRTQLARLLERCRASGQAPTTVDRGQQQYRLWETYQAERATAEAAEADGVARNGRNALGAHGLLPLTSEKPEHAALLEFLICPEAGDRGRRGPDILDKIRQLTSAARQLQPALPAAGSEVGGSGDDDSRVGSPEKAGAEPAEAAPTGEEAAAAAAAGGGGDDVVV